MKTITAIIETPKGSAEKYNYDEKHGFFKLSKIMPAGMVFPFDFGFIPGTKGEDGDPLDIIVLSELKSFTGCAMDCRIIGAIKAVQKEKSGEKMRNDRFLAIPVVSVLFGNIETVAQLPVSFMKELEAFFKNYNKQAEKKFRILEVLDAGSAAKLLAETK
jgi:inorganic pyrophosphatase